MAGYKGKQGRKPVPTPIRLLRGNPGKRPLLSNEPKVGPKLLRPPRELSDAARKVWSREGKMLLNVGVITALDAAAFAAYCVPYARWLEVTALLAKSPTLIKNRHGDLVLNPLLRVAREAQEQYTRALAEFGMSPVSRTRVHAAETPEADEFAEFKRG